MLSSSTSSYWVGIGGKYCRNEAVEDDGNESNRRKFCGYKDRKEYDSDGWIGKWCIVLSEVKLQSCDAKEDELLECW